MSHKIRNIHLYPVPLLVIFVAGLLMISWGRWDGWDADGFRLYFTQPIMQTTLYDFAWILAALTLLIHQDARRVGVTYWWIIPFYPFMPGVGVLLYVINRQVVIRRKGGTPPPLGGDYPAPKMRPARRL